MPRLGSRVRISFPAPDSKPRPCRGFFGLSLPVWVSCYKGTHWLGGRVVMQRPAKPCTAVRFRPQPPIMFSCSTKISPSPDVVEDWLVPGLMLAVIISTAIYIVIRNSNAPADIPDNQYFSVLVFCNQRLEFIAPSTDSNRPRTGPFKISVIRVET